MSNIPKFISGIEERFLNWIVFFVNKKNKEKELKKTN